MGEKKEEKSARLRTKRRGKKDSFNYSKRKEKNERLTVGGGKVWAERWEKKTHNSEEEKGPVLWKGEKEIPATP